jgi:hypothetical protein
MPHKENCEKQEIFPGEAGSDAHRAYAIFRIVEI